MSRTCVTCTAPDRAAIEQMIASGMSLSEVARTAGKNRDALRRHRDAHMTPAVIAVRTSEIREEANAKRAADRVASLLEKLEALVERTHDERRESMLLGASRELRAAIELAAKLSGELRPENQTTVQVLNVQTDPQWVELRSRILRALDRHPQAKVDVIEALSGQSNVETPGRLLQLTSDPDQPLDTAQIRSHGGTGGDSS